MYFKVLTFEKLGCQPEPVEGGFLLMHRVRQAHPDSLLKIESLSFAKGLFANDKNCLLNLTTFSN